MENDSEQKKTGIKIIFTSIGLIVLGIFFLFVSFKSESEISKPVSEKSASDKSLDKYLDTKQCFIKIEISEKKVADSVEFSVSKTENLYGIFDHMVEKYFPDQGTSYILESYGKNGSTINQYALHSSRFLIVENSEKAKSLGGIIELPTGLMDSIIPYNSNVLGLRVVNSDEIKDLNIDVKSLTCVRTCKFENETGVFSKDSCCDGLNPESKIGDPMSFICTK